MLGIFSKRIINAMEELCFDYGENGNPTNDDTTATASSPKCQAINRKPCYCGTKICRHYLPNL